MKLKNSLKVLGLMLIFMFALNVNVYADGIVTINVPQQYSKDPGTVAITVEGAEKSQTDTITTGTTVTLTATPAESRFALNNFTSEGITFTNVSENVYTFVMPSGSVTITANFKGVSFRGGYAGGLYGVTGSTTWYKKSNGGYGSSYIGGNGANTTTSDPFLNIGIAVYLNGDYTFDKWNITEDDAELWPGSSLTSNPIDVIPKRNFTSSASVFYTPHISPYSGTSKKTMDTIYLDDLINNKLSFKTENGIVIPFTIENSSGETVTNFEEDAVYTFKLNTGIKGNDGQGNTLKEVYFDGNLLADGDYTTDPQDGIQYQFTKSFKFQLYKISLIAKTTTYKYVLASNPVFTIPTITGGESGSKVFLGWSTENNNASKIITTPTITLNNDINLYAIYDEYQIIQYPNKENNYTLKDNTTTNMGAKKTVNIDLIELTKTKYLTDDTYPFAFSTVSNDGSTISSASKNISVTIAPNSIAPLKLMKNDKIIIHTLSNNDKVTSFKIKDGKNAEVNYTSTYTKDFTYTILNDYLSGDNFVITMSGSDEFTISLELIRKDELPTFIKGDSVNHYEEDLPNNNEIKFTEFEENKNYYLDYSQGLAFKSLDDINDNIIINAFNSIPLIFEKPVSTGSSKKAYTSKEINKTEAIDASTGLKKQEAVISGSGRKGSTVTISLPENRRVLEVLVTDKKGNNIELNKEDDRTYSFIQPASNVNVDIKYINKEITLNLNNTVVDIDGEKKTIDVMPQIKNDRTMVPLRFIMETLGLGVEWLPEDPDIVRYNNADGTTTIINVKTGEVFLEGKEIELDAKPYVENDRTMVPVRFISESTGAVVNWDEKKPNEVKIYEVE